MKGLLVIEILKGSPVKLPRGYFYVSLKSFLIEFVHVLSFL